MMRLFRLILGMAFLVLAHSSADAQTKRKVVFGVPVTPPNVVHLPPYIAKDMGFFDELNIDVELVTFEGGTQTLRGSVAGGLDITGTSSDRRLSPPRAAPAPKYSAPTRTSFLNQCWCRAISRPAKISKVAKSAYKKSALSMR